MNRQKLALSILILGAGAAIYYLRYFYAYVVFGYHRYMTMNDDARLLIIQGTSVLLCIALTLLICDRTPQRALHYLGLDKNPLPALALAVLCSAPMFIGFGAIAHYQKTGDVGGAVWTSLWAGFNEELIFRAFLAGLLMRKAGWNFIPAAIISGIPFAAGHLYQATGGTHVWAIFGFTLLAHVGFFALYKYWNWNLWFVIFLHGLMDLSFSLFTPAENVLLNGPANLYRGITLALAVVFTVVFQIRLRKRALLNVG